MTPVRTNDPRCDDCPACLTAFFTLPVRKRHPEYSYEQALFAAIEVMEDLAEVDFRRRERAR
jgi:hypothetical protein